MKKIILLAMLSSMVFAKIPESCSGSKAAIERNGLDMDTKTLKSWIRLLKNRSKMGEYGVTLSKSEVKELIDCLTIELDNKQKAGKMR